MLLEFTVGNFLSFKDKKTFSLEAGSITEHKDNVVKEGKYKVLRSAVIYGANSSGKSNFIKALDFMTHTIEHSSKLNSVDSLNSKPFLLNDKTQNSPSYFEILILAKNTRYRYGFELDNKKIHNEWLYTLQNSKKEELLFIRTVEGIAVSDNFKEAEKFIENTRDNGLFLSLLDQFNIEVAKSVMGQISDIYIKSGLVHEKSIVMTSVLTDLNNGLIEEFINRLDLGFEKIIINSDDEYTTASGYKKKIKTLHNVYNDKGKKISEHEFKLTDSESSGTNKIFDLSGFLVYTLQYGLQIIIDELDSKLHPILTQEIIKLFNDPDTNPRNAQLIFTTHDTNLLSSNLFRRDQIWFTEKDDLESTDLYSLLEFKDDGKTIRKDSSFEKDYIKGRYGAIPYISNFKEI